QGAEKHEVHAATGTTVGLAGIDLDIPAERITCIMGLSGSGKSTLVRHLNRLIEPTVGTIHFDGVDILQLSLSELREWRRLGSAWCSRTLACFPISTCWIMWRSGCTCVETPKRRHATRPVNGLIGWAYGNTKRVTRMSYPAACASALA